MLNPVGFITRLLVPDWLFFIIICVLALYMLAALFSPSYKKFCFYHAHIMFTLYLFLKHKKYIFNELIVAVTRIDECINIHV